MIQRFGARCPTSTIPLACGRRGPGRLSPPCCWPWLRLTSLPATARQRRSLGLIRLLLQLLLQLVRPHRPQGLGQDLGHCLRTSAVQVLERQQQQQQQLHQQQLGLIRLLLQLLLQLLHPHRQLGLGQDLGHRL